MMRFVKLLCAVLISLVVSSVSALAATPKTAPLSFVNNMASFAHQMLHGGFEDIWTFSVSTPATVSYDTYAYHEVGRIFFSKIIYSEISGYDISLWDANNQAVIPVVERSGGMSGTAFLNAGDYFLRVVGAGSGVKGGSYSGRLTVVPVPEPGEWVLMLSGIALIGFMMRRQTSV